MSGTVAPWPAYRFLRRQVRWSGIPISLRIFQFVVIHTVKGIRVVNEAEVDVFLESPCFLYDPLNVDNLTSGSSTFSKPSLYIWKFAVQWQTCQEIYQFKQCQVWDQILDEISVFRESDEIVWIPSYLCLDKSSPFDLWGIRREVIGLELIIEACRAETTRNKVEKSNRWRKVLGRLATLEFKRENKKSFSVD